MTNTLELTNANIYLKDGSKKHVSILGNIMETIEQKVQFISNANLINFQKTGNNQFIESIDTEVIEGIDIALK